MFITSYKLQGMVAIIMPILELRMLRPREVKHLTQDHMALRGSGGI